MDWNRKIRSYMPNQYFGRIYWFVGKSEAETKIRNLQAEVKNLKKENEELRENPHRGY